MTEIVLQPFEWASIEEVLPAGSHEIETELMDLIDWIEPGKWRSSALVQLKSRTFPISRIAASGDRRMKPTAKQFAPTGVSR